MSPSYCEDDHRLQRAIRQRIYARDHPVKRVRYTADLLMELSTYDGVTIIIEYRSRVET